MKDFMEVSYSKIKAWRYCRQAYRYGYIEKIEPRLKPRPLEMGKAIHSMIEMYRKKKDWKEKLNELQTEYNKLLPEEKENLGDIPSDVKRIVEGYIRTYKEADKSYRFQLIEEKLGPVQITPDVFLTFHPDCTAIDTMGRLLLVEVKTGRSLPSEDFRLWNLQSLIYVWALRQLKFKVHGILWDHIRTKAPTIPRVLQNGTMSLRDIDTDYYTYMKALKGENLDPVPYTDFLERLRGRNNFFVRYTLPVKENMLEKVLADIRITCDEMYHFGDHITRDISQSKCPHCMYRPLCEAVLFEGDEEYIREHDFVIKQEREEEEEET